MKIGLLTVYFADYGSFYHSMALYRYLQSLGHDVELIHESHRYAVSQKLMLSSIGAQVFPPMLNNRLRDRVTAYNTYCVLRSDLRSVHIGPRCRSARKRYAPYDCVVVGSDELWSVTNPNIGYIKDYFGIGLACPHISYATSGITIKPDEVGRRKKEEMIQGLRTFKALSTRDDTTKAWVQAWTGKNCPVVLDPTLLNPFFVEHAPQENVVVVYGEHFSQPQRQAIRAFAEERKMPLLSVAWKHDWCDMHLQAGCAADVQRAFSAAAFCMSSTFHGTVFSILAHRPFMSFTSELRGAKIRTLLEDLNLTDRLYTQNGGILDKAIDYGAVEELLSRQRRTSEEYLRGALALCR